MILAVARKLRDRPMPAIIAGRDQLPEPTSARGG